VVTGKEQQRQEELCAKMGWMMRIASLIHVGKVPSVSGNGPRNTPCIEEGD
jgi:hypothetical protein